MFVRFGKLLVIGALIGTIGGPWTLLQAVAWTTMLVDNLQSCSIKAAVVKTFGGRHPCCLCNAIAAGKKSEKKDQLKVRTQKLEFPLANENPVLVTPLSFQLLLRAKYGAEALPQKPPAPPPRGFFV